MEVQKIKTDNEALLFIGFKDELEYYLNVSDGRGSFVELRPYKEGELREIVRERDIEEYYNIPDGLANYIDYEKFADDMEAEWYENSDVCTQREEYEGTLYLTYQMISKIKWYFEENSIINYVDYCNHFETIGLTELEFNEIKSQYLK